jgi:hypothetical protein
MCKVLEESLEETTHNATPKKVVVLGPAVSFLFQRRERNQ